MDVKDIYTVTDGVGTEDTDTTDTVASKLYTNTVASRLNTKDIEDIEDIETIARRLDIDTVTR